MEIFNIIQKLIEAKREGEYWDFKEAPYSNNSDLLHDILCMSNSLSKNNKYLIIGVSDPKDECKIIGLPINRKKQSDYIDFIRSKSFASDNRPEIELRTIEIDSKEIDILIIMEKPNKPYYLSKDFMGIKANYIYTRTGDTNTPKDKSADSNLIEKMWRQRFGMDITPSEKYRIILDYTNRWNMDIGNKRHAYYIDSPEYQIEFSEVREGWEPYSYFFINTKSFFGTAYFKYLSTSLFEIGYGYVDEFRIPIAIPKIGMFDSKEKHWYYYYEKDSLRYKFFNLIGLNTILINHSRENLPFIFFKNENERSEYNNYLRSIDNLKDIIHKNKNAKSIIDDMKSDGKDYGDLVYFICFAVEEYYKWSNY